MSWLILSWLDLFELIDLSLLYLSWINLSWLNPSWCGPPWLDLTCPRKIQVKLNCQVGPECCKMFRTWSRQVPETFQLPLDTIHTPKMNSRQIYITIRKYFQNVKLYPGWWVGGWLHNHATSWSNLQDCKISSRAEIPSWTECGNNGPVSPGQMLMYWYT